MLDHFNLKYFLISFCVGIMVVYITQPKTQIVHKFPSPMTIEQKYRDGANNCYKFEAEEVECTPGAELQPVVLEPFGRLVTVNHLAM